ncbi:hypothetical protein [Sphingobium yanoikuyae]|uniref:hypothetical protein n=1 Tax=Sphingobium yanoikuyae TaxID=13690 RepID=UPI0035AF2368
MCRRQLGGFYLEGVAFGGRVRKFLAGWRRRESLLRIVDCVAGGIESARNGRTGIVQGIIGLLFGFRAASAKRKGRYRCDTHPQMVSHDILLFGCCPNARRPTAVPLSAAMKKPCLKMPENESGHRSREEDRNGSGKATMPLIMAPWDKSPPGMRRAGSIRLKASGR